MDPLTGAMLEIAGIDELSQKDSFLHNRHPLVKLLLTICYIFVVVSFPVDSLSGIIPMVLIPVIWYQMADISLGTCFYKLRVVLPLVCAVGIWNPILDREPVLTIGMFTVTSGMISFLTLLIKGVLSLMVSFLLIATTNIEKICYALRMLHVPAILVTQILITYRYISLLLKEAGTMFQTYSLRAPGQKGIHFSAWGSFIGQLLLRSMDRAQALFQSMQMRGFTGSFYYAGVEKPEGKDWIFAAVSIGAIILFRMVNISEWLGGLF